jgi:hypothetical protein
MSNPPSLDHESALVEVLSFPGCPNRETLMGLLPSLIAASGVPTTVVERIVDTDDAAQSERFLGSPTVRIDGIDVEVDASSRTRFGLMCRIYQAATGPHPIPPDSWIAEALSRHLTRSTTVPYSPTSSQTQ